MCLKSKKPAAVIAMGLFRDTALSAADGLPEHFHTNQDLHPALDAADSEFSQLVIQAGAGAQLQAGTGGHLGGASWR